MERGFIFPFGKRLLQLGKQIFADSVDRAGTVESDVAGLALFSESLLDFVDRVCLEGKKCVCCGKEAKFGVVWAKAY